MLKFIATCLVTAALLTTATSLSAQDNNQPASNICGTAEGMKALYEAHPEVKAEAEAFEIFTQQFIQGNAKSTANAKYTIPVVFHVYGNTQGGYPITDALIQLALDGVNDDFNGLNADFGTVHSQFLALRGTLDIEFVLAKKDPMGNPTTGIEYLPVAAGYAHSSAKNAQIAAEAWDNYKYMNIYIMEDLFDNGVTNNSGYAFYPNSTQSNANLARIVYNGRYLATNNVGNPEFASVLTHECGHFLNLQHTFEGGCTMPNDNVADTPPCTTAQGCHNSPQSGAPLNCYNNLLNAENYMDYNSNCYKMFTQGQISRMIAGLNHPARITLWDSANLVATGVTPVSVAKVDSKVEVYNLYPNPSDGQFGFTVKTNNNELCTITVTDIVGRIVYNQQTTTIAGNNRLNVDITGQQPGIYLLQVQTPSAQKVLKLRLR